MLFAQMQPAPERESEIHRWHEEHIAHWLAVAGLQAVSRYEAVAGSPRWLTVFELSDLSDLSYLDRTAELPAEARYTCALVSDRGSVGDHAFLAVVAFAVPGRDEELFDEWYETEHTPLLLKAADWRRVRRYRVLDGVGGRWTHIAVHELASREVMDSPERAAARTGPLRAALLGRPWYEQAGRWVYRHHCRQVGNFG